MKSATSLRVRWQRLVSAGQTCPRCGATELEVDQAVMLLRQALTPLGIEVILEKSDLSFEQFSQDTLQSNTILINDRLLED